MLLHGGDACMAHRTLYRNAWFYPLLGIQLILSPHGDNKGYIPAKGYNLYLFAESQPLINLSQSAVKPAVHVA